MGMLESAALPMLEVPCPEFYASCIGRVEAAGGDNIRVYICVQRGGALEPVYSVVGPAAAFAQIARAVLHAVAAHHNEVSMAPTPRAAH